MNKLNIILLLMAMIFLGKTTKAQLQIDTAALVEGYLQSDNIFEGIVTEQCVYEAENGYLYTSNLIQISKIFKGNLQCGTVRLITMGGADRIKDPYCKRLY